jgi:tripartite-type tricarboxylate transporter receptor subunit TctC
MRMGFRLVTAAYGALSLLLLQGADVSHAQDYPTRPVTMVIPTGPGGGMEMLARTFATRLEQQLGKPFVIENRPGAGGVIGSNAVATATPDGYTLLVANSTNLAINVSLYKKLPYDPIRNFEPVFLFAQSPWILVVNPELPVKSPADLIALARSKPGELNYASGGQGTPSHLYAEMLRSQTGINVTHVPYKSTVQALSDVVAGHVQFMFTDLPPSAGLIKSGKLRALGVSSKTRLVAAPEIPPLSENGVPGYDAVSWQMIVAPAGTPPEIVNKLHTEIKAIVTNPEIKGVFESNGLIPVVSSSPGELPAFIKSEITRWSKIVADSGAEGID